MRGVRAACLFLMCLSIAACAAGRTAPSFETKTEIAGDGQGRIFITSNGWHSGIVLALKDLPPGRIPEAADFVGARYLEFGWGDAEYYPAQQTTVGMALRAALVPGPAVMHVTALNQHPARYFPKAEVIALTLDAEPLGRLISYIDTSFERGDALRASSSAPGLYANSRFYPAKGRFHLANTCNNWTAKGLAAAGFAIDQSEAARAEDLMVQVRLIATTTN